MIKIEEMDGVLLTPLKIISGEKGNVFHAMKKTDPGFSSFAEAYFSTVNKGGTKGWKKHKEMTLNLVVPVGAIRFVAYDDRANSTTRGKIGVVELSIKNYARLTLPPGIWLAFSGIDDFNLLLNLANLLHDPNEAINKSLEEMKSEVGVNVF